MSADPPVHTTPPDKENSEKERPKLPTTMKEFAALAKDGPIPPWYPYTGHSPIPVDHIDAIVVKVSDVSIEVRVKDKKETVKYPAHTLLATGAVCHWESDSLCYLLDDVKKGDEVVLGVGVEDKMKGSECLYLTIRRRPGGVIPPSRKPDLPKPYHEERQRAVEYEDRGEYTPEELKDHEFVVQFSKEKGLPPPPDLPMRKPRVKAEEKLRKKD
jgi:hypothetical protein